ncbi:hypothetical protein P152DRAFT_452181 [Eremomyces bilateralis CBS 781.70]|uniref:Uncharacterized protein n=1 Tax=Eremomyces bilateralis CBS 781.70 TaxID=1392243 RepID=A0A6G1FU69_9PEZI|nr:uncharacterized protein P152DRAFT_452181 [Eremomyces bilateralis CBS 781.70]KAF1809290.1 hypothetical protein P152DRAFT_452181 [Eremomyces bilateralis CBS 781.70]
MSTHGTTSTIPSGDIDAALRERKPRNLPMAVSVAPKPQLIGETWSEAQYKEQCDWMVAENDTKCELAISISMDGYLWVKRTGWDDSQTAHDIFTLIRRWLRRTHEYNLMELYGDLKTHQIIEREGETESTVAMMDGTVYNSPRTIKNRL